MPRGHLDDLDSRSKALAEIGQRRHGRDAWPPGRRLDACGVGLKDRVITAPINGTVITKPAAVGEIRRRS